MSMGKGRILVVDDEMLNRTLLATNLDEAGYVVETAEERPGYPAPSLRNALRLGFEVAYTRPNYIYELENQ